MSNNKKMKREKKIKRCALTGKIINPNEQIIPISKAKEYVIKQGYKLIPLSSIENLKVMVLIFLIFGAFLLIPSINAQPIFQTSDSGLILQTSYSETHYLNMPLYINVHSHDRATGLIINSSLLNGFYHLYSHEIGGIHIIHDGVLNNAYNIELYDIINESYFNQTGEYTLLIWVERNNGESEGGFFSYNFEVVKQKTINESNIFNMNLEIDYLIILAVVMVILLVAFVLIRYELILLSALFTIVAGAILLFNELIIMGILMLSLGIIIAFMGRGNN